MIATVTGSRSNFAAQRALSRVPVAQAAFSTLIQSGSTPGTPSATTTKAKTQRSPATTSLLPQRRFVHVEKTIEKLGITLPKPAGPRANYDVVCHDQDANVLYVSGHLPFENDGTLLTGKITGDEGRDVEYGYKAARQAALNIVSTLSDRLGGDLDRVAKIQKVFGIVQSSDDFRHQHLVMDGASDVFMEIFGDDVGYHARSAIGTSTLPLDITVEIEAIVKLKPELRFVVGQRVECRVGPAATDWAEGRITRLRYKEPEWEDSAPYQILLDDGRYIFAPEDTEAVIREAKPQNQ